eukprot:g18968.t1
MAPPATGATRSPTADRVRLSSNPSAPTTGPAGTLGPGPLLKNRRDVIICHACGAAGHYARDCGARTLLPCRYCQRPGHFWKDCPRLRFAGSTEGNRMLGKVVKCREHGCAPRRFLVYAPHKVLRKRSSVAGETIKQLRHDVLARMIVQAFYLGHGMRWNVVFDILASDGLFRVTASDLKTMTEAWIGKLLAGTLAKVDFDPFLGVRNSIFVYLDEDAGEGETVENLLSGQAVSFPGENYNYYVEEEKEEQNLASDREILKRTALLERMVFVLGDHEGVPDRELGRRRVNGGSEEENGGSCVRVRLSRNGLLGSACVAVLHYLLDEHVHVCTATPPNGNKMSRLLLGYFSDVLQRRLPYEPATFRRTLAENAENIVWNYKQQWLELDDSELDHTKCAEEHSASVAASAWPLLPKGQQGAFPSSSRVLHAGGEWNAPFLKPKPGAKKMPLLVDVCKRNPGQEQDLEAAPAKGPRPGREPNPKPAADSSAVETGTLSGDRPPKRAGEQSGSPSPKPARTPGLQRGRSAEDLEFASDETKAPGLSRVGSGQLDFSSAGGSASPPSPHPVDAAAAREVSYDGSRRCDQVFVFGDVHGALDDLILALANLPQSQSNSKSGFWNRSAPAGQIVFLGDYGDRAAKVGDSFYTLVFFLHLQVAFPDRVVLLRGNHETRKTFYEFARKPITESHGFGEAPPADAGTTTLSTYGPKEEEPNADVGEMKEKQHHISPGGDPTTEKGSDHLSARPYGFRENTLQDLRIVYDAVTGNSEKFVENEVFPLLPQLAVVFNRILVVHAGVSSMLKPVAELRKIDLRDGSGGSTFRRDLWSGIKRTQIRPEVFARYFPLMVKSILVRSAYRLAVQEGIPAPWHRFFTAVSPETAEQWGIHPELWTASAAEDTTTGEGKPEPDQEGTAPWKSFFRLKSSQQRDRLLLSLLGEERLGPAKWSRCANEVLWADPQPDAFPYTTGSKAAPRLPSDRCADVNIAGTTGSRGNHEHPERSSFGRFFTEAAAERYLRENGLALIVRGHQPAMELKRPGVEFRMEEFRKGQEESKVMFVFSSPFYGALRLNLGSFVRFGGDGGGKGALISADPVAVETLAGWRAKRAEWTEDDIADELTKKFRGDDPPELSSSPKIVLEKKSLAKEVVREIAQNELVKLRPISEGEGQAATKKPIGVHVFLFGRGPLFSENGPKSALEGEAEPIEAPARKAISFVADRKMVLDRRFSLTSFIVEVLQRKQPYVPSMFRKALSDHADDIVQSYKREWLGDGDGKKMPLLVDVFVFGDVHGALDDLVLGLANIPENKSLGFWNPRAPVGQVVFLGDYGDRAAKTGDSWFTWLFLLHLQVSFPDRVTLLRGNHETRSRATDADDGVVPDLERAEASGVSPEIWKPGSSSSRFRATLGKRLGTENWWLCPNEVLNADPERSAERSAERSSAALPDAALPGEQGPAFLPPGLQHPRCRAADFAGEGNNKAGEHDHEQEQQGFEFFTANVVERYLDENGLQLLVRGHQPGMATDRPSVEFRMEDFGRAQPVLQTLAERLGFELMSENGVIDGLCARGATKTTYDCKTVKIFIDAKEKVETAFKRLFQDVVADEMKAPTLFKCRRLLPNKKLMRHQLLTFRTTADSAHFIYATDRKLEQRQTLLAEGSPEQAENFQKALRDREDIGCRIRESLELENNATWTVGGKKILTLGPHEFKIVVEDAPTEEQRKKVATAVSKYDQDALLITLEGGHPNLVIADRKTLAAITNRMEQAKAAKQDRMREKNVIDNPKKKAKLLQLNEDKNEAAILLDDEIELLRGKGSVEESGVRKDAKKTKTSVKKDAKKAAIPPPAKQGGMEKS